uniref:LAGLIDADG endonuclease n=1 Tax=Amoeboaphelidium protococcarum TaxID=1243177 RepID=UPI00223789E0
YCPKYIILKLNLIPIFAIKNSTQKRIGPHNLDILSIIFGTLLGDGYAEKRSNGTRICFYQENTHKAYLLYLHQLIANLGYCKISIPKLTTRLGKYGKLRLILRFKTFTFSSFNWIHKIWYKDGKKILPHIDQLSIYLTPLALAIWIMDDGSKSSSGMKISTNNFTYKEVMVLIEVLNKKYNLNTTINSAGVPDQYNIYIPKKNINNLYKILEPYIHPSMKYKFMIEN